MEEEKNIKKEYEYHAWINDKDEKIMLYNTRNTWKWHQIISVNRKGMVEYVYDIDTGLVLRFYKAKNEKCFDIIKNKSIGMLENPVSIIDEQLLEEIFKACYELEHVSY